jgi:hypothetical protein
LSPLNQGKFEKNLIPVIKGDFEKNLIPVIKGDFEKNLIPPLLRGVRGDRDLNTNKRDGDLR